MIIIPQEQQPSMTLPAPVRRRNGSNFTWTSRFFSLAWGILVIVPLLGLVIWSLLATKGFEIVFEPTLDAYRNLFSSGRGTSIARTLRISATVTIIEMLLAFPFAFWLAKLCRSLKIRVLTLGLLTVPFFLSMEARTIVWRSVLGRTGLINSILIGIGLVDSPLDWLLFSEFSVHLGLIGPYFPTMVFPIYLAVTMIDDELLDASRDLGAGWFQSLRYLVIPLSTPGIISGILFTFVPMLGETVVPGLLGGGNVALLGSTLEGLLKAFEYSKAAATSVFLLGIMGILLAMLQRAGGIGAIFESLRR
jgi:ABC-type spermidine/putrescine transport system permease subunit I